MLRASGGSKDNPVILMGLSEGNIERLKAGYPIKTPISTYGVDLPGTISVIYGKTEADLERILKDAGVIGENTRGGTDPKVDQHAEARSRFEELAEPIVWATAKVMVRALFLAGHKHVILDATNVSNKRRNEWQDKEWGTFFKVFDTSKEECLKRAGDDEVIKPVIERMAASYEPLDETALRW